MDTQTDRQADSSIPPNTFILWEYNKSVSAVCPKEHMSGQKEENNPEKGMNEQINNTTNRKSDRLRKNFIPPSSAGRKTLPHNPYF